jgi:hypothetical protein
MLENYQHRFRMAMHSHGRVLHLQVSRAEQMQQRSAEKELADLCRRNAIPIYELLFVPRALENELALG